jgi:hypothetical protein
MSRIPLQKIELRFTDVKLDPSYFPFEEDWQILLGVVGDFSVQVDSRVLYHEVDFCLVELAFQICEWSNQGYLEDFVYTSLESDETGLFWIKAANGMWKIGSTHEKYKEESQFALSDIKSSLNSYLKNIIDAVPFQLKDRVLKLLNLSARDCINVD